MGGAAAGVKFYCAYPMSPSAGVLHWMAQNARDLGIMVLQGEDEIAAFTGGAEMADTGITLTAPEIAENGNTVPVSVSVESAMEGDDLVESVMIVADGNPNPAVATFHFTPMSGEAAATSRMRLAQTQNVIAVARMKDGSVFMDKKLVKVTIGGCGG
mgnify:CR=1 FL=1